MKNLLRVRVRVRREREREGERQRDRVNLLQCQKRIKRKQKWKRPSSSCDLFKTECFAALFAHACNEKFQIIFNRTAAEKIK